VKIFSRKIFALEVGLGQEELQGIPQVSTRKSKKNLEHRSGKIYFCLCNEISTPQPKL